MLEEMVPVAMSGQKAGDGMTEQLEVLQQQLKDAVQTEDYIMAAKYRDKIKELKEGNSANA